MGAGLHFATAERDGAAPAQPKSYTKYPIDAGAERRVRELLERAASEPESRQKTSCGVFGHSYNPCMSVTKATSTSSSTGHINIAGKHYRRMATETHKAAVMVVRLKNTATPARKGINTAAL